MRIAVMANGEWDIAWGRKLLESSERDIFICADGGANHLISSGRIPDVVVGDLDSITEENLKKCQAENSKIVRFPRQKDQTDLELAIEYAEELLRTCGKPEDEITLYAGGGKRLDHLLGNIALMLACAEKGRRIILADHTCDAWVMLPGKAAVCGKQEQELSIVPLSGSARISSAGLFYELNNLILYDNATRGISNVLKKEEAVIEVHAGKVLIVMLKQ